MPNPKKCYCFCQRVVCQNLESIFITGVLVDIEIVAFIWSVNNPIDSFSMA